MKFILYLALAINFLLVGCGGGADSNTGQPTPPPITNASTISSVEVTPAKLFDYWGYAIQMNAVAKDTMGATSTNASFVWTSSDPNLASVDSTGLVTLKNPGNVKISAAVGTVTSNAADVTSEGFSNVFATKNKDSCSTNESRTQILCWGDGYSIYPNRPLQSSYPTPTPLLMGAIPQGTKIKQIAPGFNLSCAVTDDGEAYCWRGALSESKVALLGVTPNSDSTRPQKVLQGERPAGVSWKSVSVSVNEKACGVGTDNEVYCWGDATAIPNLATPPAVRPSFYSEPKKIARGSLNSTDSIATMLTTNTLDCGLTGQGTPFCWLLTNSGKLATYLLPGAVPSNTKLVDLKSDDNGNFIALGDDGWAYTWGGGLGHRAGDGTTEIITGSAALTPRRVAQGEIPTGQRLIKVAVGGISGASCVVTEAGDVFCWGTGAYGSLGNGITLATQNVATPKKALRGAIPSSTKAVDILCGTYHCAILGSDRKVYSWGYNEDSALGISTNGPSTNGLPVEIVRIGKL